MVGTCANCSEPFHSLRSGKLFLVEARGDMEPVIPAGKQPVYAPIPRRILYFWLCGECAKTLRVVFDRRSGVRVEALPVAVDHMQAAAADKAERNKEAA